MDTEENFNKKEYFEEKINKERRNFIRVPFKKNISYRICYDKFSSEKIIADSENIGCGGILFKTKWPPPTMSIIAIDLDIHRLKQYITEKGISHDFDTTKLYTEKNRIYGEVVRIKEYPESGYFDVAIKFIHREKKR